MKPWELVVGRLVSILLNDSRKCILENVLSRPVMSMTTDSLAVSKPVSWACLEKFQNLCRAFRVNDLSGCGGSFNSIYVTVARARKETNPKKLLKILGWKELCVFCYCGTTESVQQGLLKFLLNHRKGWCANYSISLMWV